MPNSATAPVGGVAAIGNLLSRGAGLDRRDAQVREGLIDVVRVHELQLRRARVSYSYRVFDPKLQLKITL